MQIMEFSAYKNIDLIANFISNRAYLKDFKNNALKRSVNF